MKAIVGRYYAAGGIGGLSDHGDLFGLTGDDHTQYSLVDGTRAYTGTVGGITPSADAHLTTKEYVDDLVIPIDYPPDSVNVATGVTDAGDVNSLITLDDGDSLDVSEVVGVPGYNIEIDFVSVLEIPTRLDIHGFYDGISGHTVNVQIYDQVGLAWDTLGTIPSNGLDFVYLTYDIINGAKYIKGDDTVETRIYHVNAGNITHDIFLDYVSLRKIPVGGGGGITDHGGLRGLEDNDHDLYTYREHALSIKDPKATDVARLNPGFVYQASTVVQVIAVVPVGTFTFNIESRGKLTPDNAGTDIDSAEMVATVAGLDQTSGFENGNLSANTWLYVAASGVTGSPTNVDISIVVRID